MSTPFSIQGTLNLPGSPELPADPLPFGLSSQYDSKAEYELNLPAGPGTQTVDFGTMPVAGVKAMLLVYEAKVAAPAIMVKVNGSVTGIEVTTGGSMLIASPAPVAGVTSLSIAYTGAGRVRVWLLG